MFLGYDIAASKTTTIKAGEVGRVQTGIRIEAEAECRMMVLICGRAGLTTNGILVQTGVLNTSDGGGIEGIVFNSTDRDFDILAGDRFAQLVLMR